MTRSGRLPMIVLIKGRVDFVMPSKLRDLNAAINLLHMGLIKVGKNVGRGAPELTPVESATAAELSKGGLRVVTL